MQTKTSEVLLYTMEDCIFCKILKDRLNFEKIEYTEVKDPDVIRSMGFETVPRLEVSGILMDFNESIALLNNGWRKNNAE